MNNVTPIRGGELVPILEGWLDQARKGEIKAMSFAAVMDNDATCEGWVGNIDDCALLLFAAINIMRDGYFHDQIEHCGRADLYRV